MNERGVSLFRLIGAVLVVGTLVFIVFPGVNSFMSSGQLATFLTYEKNMESAATTAVKNCVGSGNLNCANPQRGETENVQLSYLVKKGYIKEIKAPNGDTCDLDKSFVQVIGNGNLNFDYKVCLYCGNYVTDDELCK